MLIFLIYKTGNLTLNNLLLTSNNASINQTASTLQNQTEIKQKYSEFEKVKIKIALNTVSDLRIRYPPVLKNSLL